MKSLVAVVALAALAAASLAQAEPPRPSASPDGARKDEPRSLRLAAMAPDGTAWARELRAFARSVEAESHGEVRVKLYLGGIAGDEQSVLERVQRGQLDGVAGSALCQQLAPSLRVFSVLGLFQERDEPGVILGRLRQTVDAELKKGGFVNLGEGVLGNDLLFSRAPVRSLAELRALKMWVWNLNPVTGAGLKALGLQTVALPITEASHALASGQVDALITAPQVLMAYQWAGAVRHYSELGTTASLGCLLVTNAFFESLPHDSQQTLRAAGAKLFARSIDVVRSTDGVLLGGLFEKQGLKRVPAPETFQREFRAAAQTARERIPADLLPPQLLARVDAWLTEFRASRRAAQRPTP
jgi:TRAP-type C4-dicarboxylate transport system substrate-binding protein